MNYKNISLTLLAAIVATNDIEAQTSQNTPKLVVSITIDKLRLDYLEAFAPLYGNDGFKKLFDAGLVYTDATYPFAPLDRASATASLATGTTPYYNGIVAEKWLNRETLRPVYCTDDNKYVGIQTNDKSSPANVKTSTLGDELKISTGGKSVVISVAPFKEAAVMLGGHAADGALWIDDNSGYWSTSTYYYEKKAPKWLTNYNEASSPKATIAQVKWEPSYTVNRNFSYIQGGGKQEDFSHKFSGTRCYTMYKASGLVNKDITDMAMMCVDNASMGEDDITDLLNIVYYAGNFDHRTTNNCKAELQDTYVRLDEEIARLLGDIERKVGKDNALFVVTSTGCIEDEIGDYARYNIPTGTFFINRSASLLNIYLGAVWGQGRYVDACFGSQIYLNKKLLEQKTVSYADAVNRSAELVAQMDGVRNVYTSLQLALTGDERTRRMRNGFCMERGGDIVVEINPGWQLYNEETMESHVSRASYIQFPIIFYGAGTKAERITTPVTVDRIAPTVAKAIRIRAPNACLATPLF